MDNDTLTVKLEMLQSLFIRLTDARKLYNELFESNIELKHTMTVLGAQVKSEIQSIQDHLDCADGY